MEGKERDGKWGREEGREWENREEERRKIEGREERERDRREVGRSVQKEDRERRETEGTATKQITEVKFYPNNANLDKVTTTKSLILQFLISDLNIRSLEITMSILEISKG